MREKKLYSSAIIPDDLYVQRDADRKLKEVLLRMSKPAYISVARQMGKTNLLIQTKRSLQNDTNKYVYIDLTNKFESSQDCFRYIVNQILNSNEDVPEFQAAAESIQALRKTSNNNPTEDYQNEIREILKKYKGNLIVFLDEVDDLIKYNFSDDIFGQIRKTYFINETYPVLKRVTYVLSGVIDPEKLIKTKENSPFNIAIPIYLEDFKLPEFYELIHKGDLVLDHEIKEYLFDWLNGNPRMSFEILSLVEDEYLNGKKITKELIDKIISEFYLTNFKNPPIDHIRDLIKHNTEVRKGLIKLKKGQIDEISDEIINKFYLFGITASKVSKQSLKIKNRVIELSLSDEWLEQIELEKKGYYDLGKEKIDEYLYEEGIRYLKEYIQSEPQGTYAQWAKFNIGKAYYELGKYEDSNLFLLEKPIKKETSQELYYYQIFYIGVNYIKTDNYEKSSTHFEEVILNSSNPNLILPSKLNNCEIIFLGQKTLNTETEKLYFEVLEYLNENIDHIDNKEYFLTIIYYRLGLLFHLDKENKAKAIEYFENALKYSEVKDRTVIYLYLDSCYGDNVEKRKEIYKTLTEFLIGNNVLFSTSTNIIISYNKYHLYLILSNLLHFKLNEEFESLFRHSLIHTFNNSVTEHELIFKVASFSVNNNNLEVGIALYEKVLTFDDLDQKSRMESLLILGLVSFNEKQIPKAIEYLLQYINIFKENSNFNSELKIIDFNAFTNVIDHYRDNKKYLESFEIASIIEKQFNANLSPENKASSVVILFYILDYYSYVGDISNVSKYGNNILSLIAEVKPLLNKLSYVDKKGLADIEKQTNSLLLNLRQVKQIEPIRIDREPGRNEFVKVKYKDGRIIVAKYKKISVDLKKGDCHIII